MATIKLYLDKRENTGEGTLKIMVSHRSSSTTHSLGLKIPVKCWDSRAQRVVRHPLAAEMNIRLSAILNRWELALLQLRESGAGRIPTVKELKRRLLEIVEPEAAASPKFLPFYMKFADSREAPGTRRVYRDTVRRMEAYDPDISRRSFEDITVEWLKGFERFLSETSKSANARAVHFRNIRAAFNAAIDEEISAVYPFRKFKIKSQPTPKRSLTAEQLRTLMEYPCEPYQEKYRDMFMLMFYLCGINAADLFTAKPDAVVNGRLEYVRAKTGKPYSVKIEPEAMEIMERYRGKAFLLDMCDRYKDYRDFLRRMDRELKRIGECRRSGLGGKKETAPLFPKLSQYWCRHTWATIAAELDIPKETIAAGLGHGASSVTDVYIRFDQRKVDNANRKIIDYILCDKIQGLNTHLGTQPHI